jgi:hypothetical protein
MKRYFLPFATLMFFFGVPINCYAGNGKIIIGKGSQDGVLVLCKDSEEFKRGFEKTIEGLEKRRDCYEKGSPGYDNLEAEIGRTKERFGVYKNCICGDSDGLPHLIADGGAILYGINGVEDLVIPGSIFLYSSGYIGWSARKYLRLSQAGMLINFGSKEEEEEDTSEPGTSFIPKEIDMQLTYAGIGESPAYTDPVYVVNEEYPKTYQDAVSEDAVKKASKGVEFDERIIRDDTLKTRIINRQKARLLESDERIIRDDALETKIGERREARSLESDLDGRAAGPLNVVVRGWEENFDPIILPEIKGLNSLETNEVIINVPAATYIMLTCFLWPLDAAREYFTGSLVLSGEAISVSRR